MSEIIESEIKIAYQQAWDQALLSFNNGEPATQAIQDVWEIMPPPAPLAVVATVVGAIYGDTYWTDTGMSVDNLAADLRAAGGWHQSDCINAAKTAFGQWRGLLVRGNLTELPRIPRDGSGSINASPDVVVQGKATLSVDRLLRMWNQYDYTPEPGLKNNAYGRALSVNMGVPIKQPVLRMYYSDAGFNPPPQTWVQMFTLKGSATSPMQGMQAGNINSGDRIANTDSFVFVPPGSGHYCLITVVGTEFFANNPSAQSSSNWNSYQWLNNNGAAGWHNIDVPSTGNTTLKFHNQDPRPERFILEAHCSFLPAGTIVSLECGDSRLSYPIVTGDVRVTRNYQLVNTEAELPPNFSGDLTVRFRTPDGNLLPSASSIEVRMLWQLSQGHPHYFDALDHLGDIRPGATGDPVRLNMGSFTFIGAKD